MTTLGLTLAYLRGFNGNNFRSGSESDCVDGWRNVGSTGGVPDPSAFEPLKVSSSLRVAPHAATTQPGD